MPQITHVISIFTGFSHKKIPKLLSTMMLQIPDFIYIFHSISHEIHQNGSIPRCYKWHALSQFCFMIFSMQFNKTAQYHAAANSARCLFFSWHFPSISQKRLGTKMLQITRVILFFCGISNENHQNGSVPWCYKWQISSTCFMIVPMKFTKTAQYHDATNNTRHLIFLRVFPWKSPKRLSTMMPQIPDSIYIFHGISHEIHQNGSVPRCYKWHALSQFCFMVFSMQFNKTAQYHDATNKSCCLLLSWYFPWISQIRLGTKMLQITPGIPFSRGISHANHQNDAVPWCCK